MWHEIVRSTSSKLRQCGQERTGTTNKREFAMQFFYMLLWLRHVVGSRKYNWEVRDIISKGYYMTLCYLFIYLFTPFKKCVTIYCQKYFKVFLFTFNLRLTLSFVFSSLKLNILLVHWPSVLQLPGRSGFNSRSSNTKDSKSATWWLLT